MYKHACEISILNTQNINIFGLFIFSTTLILDIIFFVNLRYYIIKENVNLSLKYAKIKVKTWCEK